MSHSGMTNSSRRHLSLLVAAVFTATTAVPAFAAPAPRQNTPLAWRASQLFPADATVISTARLNDQTTWVSGMRFASQGGSSRFEPVLWERDEQKGGRWSEVPAASVSYDTRFNDVDVSSPRNALIVGDRPEAADGIVTRRWDGRTWTTALAPVPKGTVSAGFLSAEALSPTQGWAAG
ncbi:hypothetical protein ABZ714_23150 [Streptomyces sp. NPDC006798]|uniref:hypothetical protein n=1 Tax=Streptomyces sp. NPDC006798 TaxID=3155462 RepID=UPI0033C503ED